MQLVREMNELLEKKGIGLFTNANHPNDLPCISPPATGRKAALTEFTVLPCVWVLD
jgi:hypothetical protein